MLHNVAKKEEVTFMHEKVYWRLLETLFRLQVSNNEVNWELMSIIEQILVLFRFSDSKEVVFENFKFGFGLPMYSVARVYLDFGLNLFKTKGLSEVKKNGLKT